MNVEKAKAIEVLEARVDELEGELADYRERDAKAEREADDEAWCWTKHSKSEEKGGLPVPRLEIRWRPLGRGEWNWLAEYCLVYRHLLGEVIRVPLSMTRRGGGGPERPPVRDGKVETPFRDGAHLMCEARSLNLPAFAICGDIVTPINPLEKEPSAWAPRNK